MRGSGSVTWLGLAMEESRRHFPRPLLLSHHLGLKRGFLCSSRQSSWVHNSHFSSLVFCSEGLSSKALLGARNCQMGVIFTNGKKIISFKKGKKRRLFWKKKQHQIKLWIINDHRLFKYGNLQKIRQWDEGEGKAKCCFPEKSIGNGQGEKSFKGEKK